MLPTRESGPGGARHAGRSKTPLSRLPVRNFAVQEAEDDWRFVETDQGTQVERTFALQLRSSLWLPLAFALMHVFLRVALARDMTNIGRALAVRVA